MSRQILLTPDLVADFRARPLVIASPHFDDACFSLGCFLEQVGQGTLINIFTRGTWIPGARAVAEQANDPRFVHRLRDAEDRAFAECCGLVRHDLEAAEPSLGGRSFRAMSHVADDIAAIETPLLGRLSDIAASWPPGTRGRLFAPMGIGHHVNHHAVAAVILDNLAALARAYDVFLFEDIPYAYNPLKRLSGLARARLKAALETRYVLPLAWGHKKKLITLYRSQFRQPPLGLKFRPAALSPAGFHEAFWPALPAGKG